MKHTPFPPTKTFNIGDRVSYTGFASDSAVTGTITGVGEHNGSTVYDVRTDEGDNKWGYAFQFETI